MTKPDTNCLLVVRAAVGHKQMAQRFLVIRLILWDVVRSSVEHLFHVLDRQFLMGI